MAKTTRRKTPTTNPAPTPKVFQFKPPVSNLARLLTPEFIARFEAEMEEHRASGNVVPPGTFFDDGPDPFGMDWEWLDESKGPASEQS